MHSICIFLILTAVQGKVYPRPGQAPEREGKSLLYVFGLFVASVLPLVLCWGCCWCWSRRQEQHDTPGQGHNEEEA